MANFERITGLLRRIARKLGYTPSIRDYYRPSLGGNGLKRIYDRLSACDGYDMWSQLEFERPEQEIIAKFMPRQATVLELGAGKGSTAAVIDKILDNPKRHVVIDPSREACSIVSRNKTLTDSSYALVHGFLAENRKGQEDLWDECKACKNYSLKELEQIAGGKFDCIIADCEGAFIHILNDFKDLLDTVELIVIELDGDPLNCQETVQRLTDSGFTRIHSQCHPFYNFDGWNDDKNKGLQCLNPKKWHNGIGFHEAWVKFVD